MIRGDGRCRGATALHFYSYDAIVTSVIAPKRATSTQEARLRLAAVNRNDPTLLHEQVAVELRRAIAQGEARPGDRIPQAKDLAAVLGVNTNTVLRALRLLRDQGLLEVGRGRAIRVAGTPERTAVIEAIGQLVELGRRNGYRRADLAAMLESFPS
ncbi:MAG: GntR family transcriptional regulator [Solirubrobacterales bacterium]|nr:GntR family transcriptional regulator [Solirubrobacterales bacterium]